jgi:hypothetical protein
MWTSSYQTHFPSYCQRNCPYLAPGGIFNFVICFWIVFTWVVFYTFPLVTAARVIWAMSRLQRTTNYSDLKILPNRAIGLLAVWAVVPSRWKNRHSFALFRILKGAGIHPLCLSEFIVCGKKRGPIILVALTAHHTPTFMTYNGTSFVILG